MCGWSGSPSTVAVLPARPAGKTRSPRLRAAAGSEVVGGAADRHLDASGDVGVEEFAGHLSAQLPLRELARSRPRRQRNVPPAVSPPDGYVDTAAAALILGTSIRSTQRLAATERIPAYRDSTGRYWYRSEQLQLVRRARQAARDNRRR